MNNFMNNMLDSLSESGLDPEELAKAQRVGQVRGLWTKLVNQDILDHTNAVYVFDNEGTVEMHVYMDNSIFASEVNNLRALILQESNIKYGEAIEELCIHISFGQMRTLYPFKNEGARPVDQNPPVPLDSEELARVEQAAQTIENPQLRAAFKKAMIADLEWKKGNL